jgi:hypothetical protein
MIYIYLLLLRDDDDEEVGFVIVDSVINLPLQSSK